jgi:hypothetical protein
LDTKEIDAEVDRVLSADEPLPLPGFESVIARNVPPITFARRFHTRRSYAPAASLVLMVVACSGVYAWWHDARSSFSLDALGNAMIAKVRAFAKPKTPVPSNKTEKRAPKSVANNTPLPSASVQPLAEPAAVPVSLGSDTKPDESNDSGIASPAAASDFKVMLDLMAREATWLSVSSDGRPVFSGTLQPNQTKTVGGKQFAKMRVGNAAGIEVRLNGKLLGPLGARGQVLIVLFTPDNFQIFSPPKESD